MEEKGVSSIVVIGIIIVIVAVASVTAIGGYYLGSRDNTGGGGGGGNQVVLPSVKILGIRYSGVNNLEVSYAGPTTTVLTTFVLSKNGEELSRGTIPVNGQMTTQFSMTTQEHETPSGGTYKFSFYSYPDNTLLDEKTISFSGANLDILTTRLYESSDNFWIEIVNHGDLDAWISKVYLESSGQGGGYYTTSALIGSLATSWISVHLDFIPYMTVNIKLLDSTGKILYETTTSYYVY